MDRRFLAILAAIVVAFGAVVAISNHKNNGSDSNSNAQPTNHVMGEGSSGVTLVEYGDYQCPVCEGYYQPVKDAVAELSDQIHFQFRNLPLSSIHPNAFASARAAEAASLQGKFWQMHDALYDPQNYDQWAYDPVSQNVRSADPKSLFDQIAKNLGLDITKFDQDYASSSVNNSIEADINAFLSTSYANHDPNKEATPSFFVDGNYVDNSNFVDSKAGAPTAAKIESYLQGVINAKH